MHRRQCTERVRLRVLRVEESKVKYSSSAHIRSLLIGRAAPIARAVAPKVRPEGNERAELTVRRGANMRLGVYAEGAPKPALSWTLNGRAPDESRVRVAEQLATRSSSLALSAVSSSVAIREVLPSDAGEWSATATNAAGECSHVFTLRVLGATATAHSCSTVLYSDRTVLCCTVVVVYSLLLGSTIDPNDYCMPQSLYPSDAHSPDKPGRPEALHAIELGSDRAEVGWQPPRETNGSDVLSYVVETREMLAPAGSTRSTSALGFTRAGKVRAGEPLRLTLQRLRAGASYAVRVFAVVRLH